MAASVRGSVKRNTTKPEYRLARKRKTFAKSLSSEIQNSPFQPTYLDQGHVGDGTELFRQDGRHVACAIAQYLRSSARGSRRV
jgi:hypothetical protein